MSGIDELLAQVRSTYERVTATQAAALVAEEGALLVDTRSPVQRATQGEVPGALVVERNVLEWRLDPTSPHRAPELASADQPVIVLCAEGFSSSLAVASLRTLGLTRATDVVDGFLGWEAAGLPVLRP